MIDRTREVARLALLGIVLAGVACAGGEPRPDETAAPAAETVTTTCRDPRPEVCTFDYRPVCALRDTGVRCVTTPCPSSEWKTYGNGCSACSDAKVSGYRDGECPAA